MKVIGHAGLGEVLVCMNHDEFKLISGRNSNPRIDDSHIRVGTSVDVIGNWEKLKLIETSGDIINKHVEVLRETANMLAGLSPIVREDRRLL